MKKYLIVLFVGVALSNALFAQSLQATITQGSTPRSVYIKVKSKTSPYAPTVPISTVNFCLQIASTVPKPALTVVEVLPATAVGLYTVTDSSAETAAEGFYTWNIDGTDGTSVTTWTGEEEKTFLEVFFDNSPANTAIVRLVHRPEGGSTGTSTFYLSVGGIPQQIEGELFYGPTAVNNTAGVYPSGTAVVTLPGVVLPVKFLGFNAVKKENNAVLTWQIENESSLTDHYEVERSLNAVDFQRVSTVTRKNNGSTTNTYDLIDVNISALRSAGIFYYRVKQVDKDGYFVYTGIRSVRLDKNGLVFGVYPNPVKNYANLTIDSEQDTDASVSITDASGKQVQNTQVVLFKGPNIKKINMGKLSTGNYLLKIQTPTEIKTIPVVKVN
ncbi:MAG: T9SS type A sorting domain-containing protein [Ferruginibacter sp.]